MALDEFGMDLEDNESLPQPVAIPSPSPMPKSDEFGLQLDEEPLATPSTTPSKEELYDSYEQTLNVDPARTARVIDLSKKFDADPEFIDANYDDAEKYSKAPGLNFWETLSIDFPKTSKIVSEPQRMATLKNDIEPLSAIEKIVAGYSFGSLSGDINVEKSHILANQAINALVNDQYDSFGEERIKELSEMQRTAKDLRPKEGEWSLYSFPYYAGEQISNMLSMAKGSLQRGTQLGLLGATAGGVSSGPAGVGIGAAAGASAGVGFGALEDVAIMEAGSAFEEYKNITDKNGNRIPPRLAATAAISVGVVNAGLEKLALDRLLKVIPGGDRVLNFINSKNEIFKVLTPGSALKEGIKNYLAAVGAEAATETLQLATQKIGTQAIKSISGQEFNPLLDEAGKEITAAQDFSKELKGVLEATVQSTLLLGGAGTTVNISRGIADARKAELNKKAYQELIKNAEQMEINKNSPEQFQEIIEEVTQNTPVENIYIEAEVFERYFQDNKQDLDQVLESVGVTRKEFDDAKESSGDIKIKTSTWVSKAAGSKVALDLENDIKWSEDSLTPRQAQARIDYEMSLLQEEAKKAARKSPKEDISQEDYDLVYNYISDLQKNLGIKSEKQIDANARLWVARASRAASAQGKTIPEWFQGANRPVTEDQFIQMKKDLGNKQTLRQEMIKRKQAPAFYSKLQTTLEKKMPENALSSDVAVFDEKGNIIGGILKGEVTREEVDYVKLQDYLTGKERIDKDTIINFVKEKNLKIRETVRGEQGGIEGGIQFTDLERDESYDSDNIESEVENYLSDDYYVEETKKEYAESKGIDAESEQYKNLENDRDFKKYINNAAYAYASDVVSEEDYYGHIWETTLTIGEDLEIKIYGSDERSWDFNIESSPSKKLSNKLMELNNKTFYDLQDIKDEILIEIAKSGYVKKEAILRPFSDEVFLDKGFKESISWEQREKQAKEYLKKNRNTVKDLAEKEYDENNDEKFNTLSVKDKNKYYLDKAIGIIDDINSNPAISSYSIRYVKSNGIIRISLVGNNKKGWEIKGDGLFLPENIETLPEGTTIEQAQDRANQILIQNKLTQETAERFEDIGGGAVYVGRQRWGVDGSAGYRSKFVLDGDHTDYAERVFSGESNIPMMKPFYYTTHFDDKNMIFHYRYDTRVLEESGKSFFIEEFQSDVHQQGRESGYVGELDEDQFSVVTKSGKREKFRVVRDRNGTAVSVIVREEDGKPLMNNGNVATFSGNLSSISDSTDFADEAIDNNPFPENYGRTIRYGWRKEDFVPPLPYQKSWAKQGLRRIIDQAIRDGFETISWTTGKQQTERYNKQLDGISLKYRKDEKGNYEIIPIKRGEELKDKSFIATVGNLHNYIGNDAASRVLNGEDDTIAQEVFDIEDENRKYAAGHIGVFRTPSTNASVTKFDGSYYLNLPKQISEIFTREKSLELMKKYLLLDETDIEIKYDEKGFLVDRESNEEFIHHFEDLESAINFSYDIALKEQQEQGFKKLNDIQINSRGMVKFYDEIMVQEANDLFKKYGEKVRQDLVVTNIEEVVEERSVEFTKEDVTGQLGKTSTMDEIIDHAKSAEEDSLFISDLESIKSLMKEDYTFIQAASIVFTKRGAGPVSQQATSKLDSIFRELDIDARINVFPSKMKTVKTTEPVHVIKITPQMRKDILEKGQPIFQRGNKQNRINAMVDLYKNDSVIKIFKSANASSFIHESAHIWLKDLHEFYNTGGGNDQTRAEHEALMDWLGQDTTQLLSISAQEKFARGFEAFLREGRSPSEFLRKVFSSFKRWLMNIYRSIQGSPLDVGLTDEVRGIMERMIATDAEIEEAKGKLEVREMLPPEILATLSADSLARLNKIQAIAKEEAVARLLKPQVEEISKENQEKINQERIKALDRIRAEVAQEPIYRSIEDLRTVISKKNMKEVAGKYLAGALSEKDTVMFEMIAEGEGYNSGSQLASLILEAPNYDLRVQRKLDEFMLQFRPLKDKAIVKDEALKAIHNQNQLELMALERELFIGKAKREAEKSKAQLQRLAAGEEKKKQRQINMSKLKIDVEFIKSKAHSILMDMSVKDGGAFRKYFNAERNAAVKVAKALKDKDYNKAAEWKEKQMLNHALAIESIRIYKMAESGKRYLNKIRRKDPKSFKEQDHFFQVAELLSRFGFSYLKYDSVNKLLKKESLFQWSERMDEANLQSETLAQSEGIQIRKSGVAGVNIADWLFDESINIDYSNLKPEQVYDLVGAIKNIIQVANYEDKAFSVFEGQRISEIVDRLIIEGDANTPLARKHKLSQEDPTLFKGFSSATTTQIESKIEKLRRWKRKYTFNILKANTIFEYLDNWSKGSFSQITDMVFKAANQESEMQKTITEKITKAFSSYSKKELSSMVNDKRFYVEHGLHLSKMRIIVMALNIGNRGNAEKLFNTRPAGFETVEWNEKIVMDFLNKNMTERDWKLVQDIWDAIETLWPALSKTHTTITGFTPLKVEATPLVVKAGMKEIRLRGGYYPLAQDPKASYNAEVRADLEDPLYSQKNYPTKANTKQGATKARTEAQYAINLDIGVLTKHINEVIHDVSFRPVVIDLRRIFGNRKFQDMLKRNLGPEGHQVLQEWLQYVSKGGPTAVGIKSDLDMILSALRTRTSVTQLAFRVGTIMQNFANPFLFGNAVEGFSNKDAMRAYFNRGLRYMAGSIGNIPGVRYIVGDLKPARDAREMKEFVFEKSSFMRDRARTPDVALADAFKEMFGNDSKIAEFAMGLLSSSDDLTNVPMWLEAYSKKINEGVAEEDAVMFADKLINAAVGSGRKYDVAAIFRGSEAQKVFAMFYGFMNTEMNRWYKEVDLAQRDSKNYSRFLGFLGARFLFVMASTFLGGKGGDEEDEEEKIIKEYLSEAAKYPFALLPYSRDIIPIIIDQSLGLRTFGYRASPIVGTVDSFINASSKAIGSFKEDSPTTLQDAIEAGARAASFAIPYPDQFNAWAFNLWDFMANDMEPEVSDLVRRRKKSER